MVERNLTAQAGWGKAGFTDQEYIDEFNLDPNLDINEQMFDLVEKENINEFIAAGYSEKNAIEKARMMKNKAKAGFKRAMDNKQ